MHLQGVKISENMCISKNKKIIVPKWVEAAVHDTNDLCLKVSSPNLGRFPALSGIIIDPLNDLFLFFLLDYQPNTECFDKFVSQRPGKNPSCQFYAKSDFCTHVNHTEWMAKHCRRSCGLCHGY